MSEGIGEATQVIKLTVDGTTAFVRFSYSSIKELTALVIALKKSYEANLIGNIDFATLLKNADGSVSLVKVPDSKIREFSSSLQKYGLQFTQMPDLNLKDGYAEFAFNVLQTPLVRSVVNQMDFKNDCEMITLEDYAKNADTGYIADYAMNMKVDTPLKNGVSKDAPKKIQVQTKDMAKQMNETAKENNLIKDPNNHRYVVDDKEIVYSKDNKVLIPAKVKSIENEQMYIVVDNSEVVEGDKISIFFNDKKNYDLVNSNNKILDTMNGRKVREQMLKRATVKSKDKSKSIDKVVAMPLKR